MAIEYLVQGRIAPVGLKPDQKCSFRPVQVDELERQALLLVVDHVFYQLRYAGAILYALV